MVDDDDLFIGPGSVGADEYPGAEQMRRDRVLGVLEGDHRGVLRNCAGRSERNRVRSLRDPVQAWCFLDQNGRGFTPGRPVLTVVHTSGSLDNLLSGHQRAWTGAGPCSEVTSFAEGTEPHEVRVRIFMSHTPEGRAPPSQHQTSQDQQRISTISPSCFIQGLFLSDVVRLDTVIKSREEAPAP